MKTFIQFFMISFVILLTGCKQQEETNNGQADGMEEITTYVPSIMDVETAVKTFNDAIINPDKALLESLCSDKLTYCHSSGLIQNKSEFIDDIVNGPFSFLTIDMTNKTIDLSRDTAIVRYILDADATNAGEPTTVHLGMLQVFQAQPDGKWLLLARQAYKI